MARNFDDEMAQDLDFIVGGEAFTMRYVRPEVLAAWEDESEDDEESSDKILKRQDERILAFLSSEEDRKRYVAMRERDENALPLVKINELLRWMVEVQTSRPTETPSPSANGPGRTAASSGAGARSRVETPTK